METTVAFMALAALVSAVASADPAGPEPFRDGDVVCFVGDSITHSRKFHSYIYDYYLTRFPARKIRFVNCGIAGDSAAGAVRRFEWDILPHRPTVASLMLGMNDVGRGLYGKASPDAQNLAARERALTGHRQSMEQLAALLAQRCGARLVFATPSPYDETVQVATESLVGVNGALGLCGQSARELAEKVGGTVVDLHGPMTALNLEHQKTDPQFTLIGADRVHPGDVGQLVMAYLYLKAQGVPSVVASIELDATAGRVVETESCEVTGLTANQERVAFDCLAQALPWPIEQAAASALSLVPLEAELNQEVLTVRRTAPHPYRVSIDGQAIGQYSPEQLATGVNLALNASTPQHAQAKALAATNEQRRQLEVRLRSYAQVKIMLMHGKVDEGNEEAVNAYFAEFLRKNPGNGAYFSSQFNNYLKTRTVRDAIQTDIEALTQKLWTMNKPGVHHYELTPLAE